MGQSGFDGTEDGPPPERERLWLRLQRMHANGFYEVADNARRLLAEGWFSREWSDKLLFHGAVKAIEECLTSRNPDGTRRAIKTEKPRQYRLTDWATCDEGIWDLTHRVALRRQDGEAIRVDAGNLIRRWPARKAEILAILPEDIRPFEK
jgi:hypothetical protein